MRSKDTRLARVAPRSNDRNLVMLGENRCRQGVNQFPSLPGTQQH